MSDLQGTMIVVTVGLVIFLILFVFARFSYEISQDYLRIRHRILFYIPFSFCRIKTKDIQEVRRFDFKKDLLRGGFIFGNLFRKKGVMIILKRWSFRGKRIFVSPENPERFIEQMNSIIRLNFPRINSKDGQILGRAIGVNKQCHRGVLPEVGGAIMLSERRIFLSELHVFR